VSNKDEVGFDTSCLQILITIYSGALANSHSPNSAIAISKLQPTVNYTRTESSSSDVPSPVLWYRDPMVELPFSGFPNCPSTKAWETLNSQHTRWSSILNCLHLFPTVLSGALANNWLLLEVEITLHLTVIQSVSSPLWDLWPDIFIYLNVDFWKLLSCPCGAPPLTRGRVCQLTLVCSNLPVFTLSIFIFHVFYSPAIYIQYTHIQSFIQSRPRTADCALLVIISSHYHSSLDAWTVV
jgi:hypothetical protein